MDCGVAENMTANAKLGPSKNQIQIGDDDTYDWFWPTGIEKECHK